MVQVGRNTGPVKKGDSNRRQSRVPLVSLFLLRTKNNNIAIQLGTISPQATRRKESESCRVWVYPLVHYRIQLHWKCCIFHKNTAAGGAAPSFNEKYELFKYNGTLALSLSDVDPHNILFCIMHSSSTMAHASGGANLLKEKNRKKQKKSTMHRAFPLFMSRWLLIYEPYLCQNKLGFRRLTPKFSIKLVKY